MEKEKETSGAAIVTRRAEGCVKKHCKTLKAPVKKKQRPGREPDLLGLL
jgi:hypothetical protein